MDQWLKVSIVAAVLLAGAGAFHLFERGGGVQLAQQGNALEHCRQAARLSYDVHWAVACMGEASSSPADGHADCDLPDAKAAIVNAWLDEAEKRCIAEVRGAPVR